MARRVVMIVAADAGLRAAIARALRAAGYAVEVAEGAKRAREAAAAGRIDLAIVASGQLGPAGPALVQQLRDSVGKVIVAEHGGDAGRAAAARGGSVLSLAQPLSEKELVECVERALAAADRPAAPSHLLCFEGRTLDIGGRGLIDRDGRQIALTRTEFELLLTLAQNPGRVLSREQLHSAIAGADLEAYERSVDMHVSRLRRKIESAPKKPRLIVTVPGTGYKFDVPVQRVETPHPPARLASRAEPAAELPPLPERRQLTVLSGGIDGLAALARHQDTDAVQETVAALRGICHDAVTRYGGFLVSFLGDSLLAYFGWPEAHEDDAERAIRAGIDLVAAIAGPEQGGLRARIGIATRPAVVHFGSGGEPGYAAIGDDGARQQLIRTLPRKGFRLVAEVNEMPDGAAAPQCAALSDKPSLAVLPFANLGVDPEHEHFAAGAVEQILAALSPMRWLTLIERRASFAYGGHSVDAKRVGQELGVRYLVNGAVRRSGHRMRVSLQLIETETRAQLWADWCEGAIGSEFELQDQAAAMLAAAIEPVLEAAEIGLAMRRAADELSPRDLYLRARRGCYGYGAAPLLQARDLLDRAIARDPGFARALASAAGCRQFLSATGWADDRDRNRREAIELAHRALQADGDDPAVLMEAARVLGHFTEDIDSAVAMIDQAVALNPNQARAWYWSGWVRLFAGYPDTAVEHFETARRLTPSRRPYLTGLGAAHFLSRRYSEAAAALVTASHEAPGWPTTLRFLAAAYAQLGRFEGARAAVARLSAVAPAIAPAADCAGKSPFHNREQSALYLEGLQAAAAA